MIPFPIQAYCRIKPPRKEDAQIPYKISRNKIIIEDQEFLYDNIFGPSVRNEEIFSSVLLPLIKHVMQDGINATLLAYGQTGGGKTYTVSGMIRRTMEYVMAKCGPADVYLSYLQLYSEKCFDLLNSNNQIPVLKCFFETALNNLKVEPREKDRTRSLTVRKLASLEESAYYIAMGNENKITAVTKMNDHSSRSHTICTIYMGASEPLAKLHLVDLAGSEQFYNQSDNYLLRNEMKNINLSLHYLEQVIIALDEPRRSHIPYRNSLLTSMLKDSLGGNGVTSIIAVVSMDLANQHQTLATLKFAQRTQRVNNYYMIGGNTKTHENQDPKREHYQYSDYHNTNKSHQKLFQKKIERLEHQVKLRDKEISILLNMLTDYEMKRIYSADPIERLRKQNGHDDKIFSDIEQFFHVIDGDNFILNEFKIFSSEDGSDSSSQILPISLRGRIQRSLADPKKKRVPKNEYKNVSGIMNKIKYDESTSDYRESKAINKKLAQSKIKEENIKIVKEKELISRNESSRFSFYEKYGRTDDLKHQFNPFSNIARFVNYNTNNTRVSNAPRTEFDILFQNTTVRQKVNKEIEHNISRQKVTRVPETVNEQIKMEQNKTIFEETPNDTMYKPTTTTEHSNTEDKAQEEIVGHIDNELKSRRKTKIIDARKENALSEGIEKAIDTVDDVTDPNLVENIEKYLTGDAMIDEEIFQFYARRGIVVNKRKS